MIFDETRQDVINNEFIQKPAAICCAVVLKTFTFSSDM